jgi:hypothetical protein
MISISVSRSLNELVLVRFAEVHVEMVRLENLWQLYCTITISA